MHWGVWDVWSHSFGNEYYPLSDVEWLRKDLFQSSNFLLILHGNFVLSFDQEALFSNWVQVQSWIYCSRRRVELGGSAGIISQGKCHFCSPIICWSWYIWSATQSLLLLLYIYRCVCSHYLYRFIHVSLTFGKIAKLYIGIFETKTKSLFARPHPNFT